MCAIVLSYLQFSFCAIFVKLFLQHERAKKRVCAWRKMSVVLRSTREKLSKQNTLRALAVIEEKRRKSNKKKKKKRGKQAFSIARILQTCSLARRSSLFLYGVLTMHSVLQAYSLAVAFFGLLLTQDNHHCILSMETRPVTLYLVA